jgi:hypothetical protein
MYLAAKNKGARHAGNMHTQALLLLLRKKTEVFLKCAGNLAWLLDLSQPLKSGAKEKNRG